MPGALPKVCLAATLVLLQTVPATAKVRQMSVQVGPTTTSETRNGRGGLVTTTEVWTFYNVRDAVREVLAAAQMSASPADEQALVDAVKAGRTSISTLRDALDPPPGTPGEAALPAGFHNHDSGTWFAMGFDSGDWSTRYNDAIAAIGVPFNGSSLADAKAYVSGLINSGKLGSWDFGTIFNAVGWDFDFGSYTSPEDSYLKGFMPNPPPHYVPAIAQVPGSTVQSVFHNYNERSDYASADPVQTYIADAFFESQAMKWLSAQSLLNDLGASGLAGVAFNRARDDIGILSASGDPLVLDLNRNKFVDVTGLSSAIVRNRKNRPFQQRGSVFFDLYGGGPQRMEWIKGGDAFLVDAVRAKAAVAAHRNFTGRELFGDAEGYAGGFTKLRMFDKNHDGKISGSELDPIGVWIDANGDGEYQDKELHSLKELGVSEIGAKPRIVHNKDMEPLEQASFVQNGERHLIQEVWFAFEPKRLASGGQ